MENLQEIKSSLRYLRIAPRKVRLVSDLIRNKPVDVAAAILEVTNKRAAPSLLKLLKSAVANAKNNFHLEPSKLFVKSIKVDNGPMFKRWNPRARGGADPIQKKTSHVFLVLGVKKEDSEEKFKIIYTNKEKKKVKGKKEIPEESKKKSMKIEKNSKMETKVKEEGEKRKIFRRKAI